MRRLVYSSVVWIVLLVPSFSQTKITEPSGPVMAGSCASPDGRYRDDPGSCSCVDFSCGGDCASCLFSVCLSCPCLGPANYTEANADGNCYNNLSSGTYCFTYTQSSSGYQYMTIVVNDCATCNTTSSGGGAFDGTHTLSIGCTSNTYDETCTLVGANILHGTGHAGISAGEIITVCITVPIACSGTTDLCPVMRCSDNSKCGGNNGLPVNLLYLHTKRIERTVEIRWETGTEINNDFFTLQRTTDGRNFEQIINIRGAGSSSQRQTYAFVDDNPYFSVFYYRLYQTDFDGKINYLGMVAVEAYNNESSAGIQLVSMFSNAAADYFHYTLYLPKECIYSYEICDLSGKTIATKKQHGNEGLNEHDIFLTGINKGVYFLKINSPYGFASKKIFIG